MKKNDKVVVVIGVVILILAGIGIYFWSPMEPAQGTANIDEFLKMLSFNTRSAAGELMEKP